MPVQCQDVKNSGEFISMELKHHHLEITSNEKLFIAANAYIGGGLGSSIIVTDIIGFLISQFGMLDVGLGLTALMSAVFVTAGASILVVLLGIPIAYFTYKDMQDGYLYAEKIKNHEWKRNQVREALFYELLVLRCLCQSDTELEIMLANQLKQCADDEKNSLYRLVIQEFAQAIKNFSFHASDGYVGYPSLNRGSSSDNMLEVFDQQQLTFKQAAVCAHFKQRNQHFIAELNQCFNNHQKLAIPRNRAIVFGILQGFGFTGVTFGATWSVATLIASFGLVIIPGMGWGLMALACVGLGITFGIGMYFNRSKNLRREVLKEEINQQKKSLVEAQVECEALRKLEWQKRMSRQEKNIVETLEWSPTVDLDIIKSAKKIGFFCRPIKNMFDQTLGDIPVIAKVF
ncbi:MAG: hypothetical protein A3F11_06620 [Gammaproteobacteria bacterium RIFCSPHIGHO2_12_FULL_37_14]|nr:MAG: hypothetical protein A3F11_06620 [Gammaproteobacteria bacterium RIFCSPHIGHO2_12_FULL_37_14]